MIHKASLEFIVICVRCERVVAEDLGKERVMNTLSAERATGFLASQLAGVIQFCWQGMRWLPLVIPFPLFVRACIAPSAGGRAARPCAPKSRKPRETSFHVWHAARMPSSDSSPAVAVWRGCLPPQAGRQEDKAMSGTASGATHLTRQAQRPDAKRRRAEEGKNGGITHVSRPALDPPPTRGRDREQRMARHCPSARAWHTHAHTHRERERGSGGASRRTAEARPGQAVC